MSDGGLGRGSPGVKVWKSSQNVDAERSAVRSIAWLGLFGGLILIGSDVLHLWLKSGAAHQHRNLKKIGAKDGNILRIVSVEYDDVSPMITAKRDKVELHEIPFRWLFHELVKLLRRDLYGTTWL
jgi:hypothetical protein